MSAITQWFTQLIAVTALNLRTLPQRLVSSAVAIVGIAGVVAVFVAIYSGHYFWSSRRGLFFERSVGRARQ